MSLRGAVREGRQAGQIDAELTLTPRDSGLRGEFKATVDSFPLAALTPALRRVQTGLGIAGFLSTKLEGNWDADAEGRPAATVRGQMSGRGLEVVGLGTDRARLERLEAAGDASLEEGRLIVRKAQLDCDAGKATLSGVFAACPDPLAYLDQPGQNASADVDLAWLAAAVHGLIAVHDDTHLTSGRLKLQVASTPAGAGAAWEGNLRVTDLAGSRGKEAIAWQAPMNLDFRLVKSPKTLPVIEQWRMRFRLPPGRSAREREELTATVAIDLDRLAALLAPILDLGALKPGAIGSARLTLRRTASDVFQVGGLVTVPHMQFAGPGGQLVQIASAAEISGRVRPGSQLAGSRGLPPSPARTAAARAGLNVSEQALEVTTSGRWDRDKGRLEFKATRLNGDTLELNFPGLLVGLTPSGEWEASGGCTVQANVARLYRWLETGNAVGADTLSGLLSGHVDATWGSGGLVLTADGTVNDFTYGNPRLPPGVSRAVHLVARGRLEPATDQIRIDEVRMETALLAATAAGALTHASTSRDLTLSGQVQYDLQQAEPHLRPFLGEGAQVRGQAARPFRLQGSLGGSGSAQVALQMGQPIAGPVAAFSGSASLGWTSARALGCELGAGDLQASLTGGWLRLAAVECTANQGRLRLEPAVRLEPGPAELYLNKGSAVEHFHLTPAACTAPWDTPCRGWRTCWKPKGRCRWCWTPLASLLGHRRPRRWRGASSSTPVASARARWSANWAPCSRRRPALPWPANRSFLSGCPRGAFITATWSWCSPR